MERARGAGLYRVVSFSVAVDPVAMRVTLLVVLTLCAAVQTDKLTGYNLTPPSGSNTLPNIASCNKNCPPNNVCEEQTCQVCVPATPTCNTWECKKNEKCEDRPTGPVCIPLNCSDIRCSAGDICSELPDGPDCVPDVPSCEGFFCRRGTNCYIRDGSPVCLPNTCEIRECRSGLTCIDTRSGALCRRGVAKQTCKGKYCPANTKCVQTPDRGTHCAKI